MKDICYRLIWETVDKLKEETGNKKDLFKKPLYYGVSAIRLDNTQPSHKEEAETRFELINLILCTMSEFTPRDLIQMFPIDKVYDGDRYETKDYFYTMKMIEDHGLDKKIDDPFEFITDYMNSKIFMFLIKAMGTMNNLRAYEGKASMMSEFMADQRVPSYTLHQGYKGKEFFIDKNGRSINVEKAKKRLPKYLKVIR